MVHFVKETRSVKDSNGKLIIKLDVEFFDRIFRDLNVEEYADISFESTQEYCDKNIDKCMRSVSTNLLEVSRLTITRWPKFLYRSDFREEIGDMITLLSRVRGLSASNVF